MAALTVNITPPILPPTRHVLGNIVAKIFNVSGASGSTLATGMTNIVFVDYQRSTSAGSSTLITGFTLSGGTLTVSSSAPMVNEVIIVYALGG